ncbi:hypothetical protein C1646_707190 [Rhizophagus diaphanus]|nr:hypothetical protein C1646_707190 [Rhizophagus diaphanus] [Rhizophagus sp. MUCL 43196]
MYMIYEHTVYVRRQDRILLIQCQRCVPTYWLSEIKNCKIPVLQMLVNNLRCLFHNTITSEPEPMQEDAPVTHILLQLHSRLPVSKFSQQTPTVHAPPIVPNITPTLVSSFNSSVSTDAPLPVQNDELKAVIQNHSKLKTQWELLPLSPTSATHG